MALVLSHNEPLLKRKWIALFFDVENDVYDVLLRVRFLNPFLIFTWETIFLVISLVSLEANPSLRNVANPVAPPAYIAFERR